MSIRFVETEQRERNKTLDSMFTQLTALQHKRGSTRFYMSVDLGQAADYTAISVIDKIADTALVRHLERLPLGTPYPEQVKTIKRIFGTIVDTDPRAVLILDNTGVGRAVVDLVKNEGLDPISLTITAGNEATKDRFVWHIPKRDLISALIVAFQTGKIKISRSLPDADTLTRELTNFKLKINVKTGHDQYEAWRENIHDDLVLSVAMAVYAAEIGKPEQRQISRPFPPGRPKPRAILGF